MARIDKEAQEEYGIDQAVLMENAGQSVAVAIFEDFPSIKDQKISIFCGKGNNGGDGFVIARYLANESPARLIVYAMDVENIKTGAAYENFNIVRKMGIDIRTVKDFVFGNTAEDFSIGIDALFGTGFKGEFKGECVLLAKKLNSLERRFFAVDIPSGLDATTGIAANDTIKARKTITFGLPKKGFYLNDGPFVCGEIIVKNIGFPVSLLKRYV
ncbi:MAG: NAD(P)H-hydrate epimerase [Candidatus Omnitrophota bacterium]